MQVWDATLRYRSGVRDTWHNMNKAIYIVDDEESVRSALAYRFRREGFEVLTYAAGAQLLGDINATEGPIRGVFITDMRNPAMSGAELICQLALLGILDSNPLFVLSGYASEYQDRVIGFGSSIHLFEKPHTDYFVAAVCEAARLSAHRCDCFKAGVGLD